MYIRIENQRCASPALGGRAHLTPPANSHRLLQAKLLHKYRPPILPVPLHSSSMVVHHVNLDTLVVVVVLLGACGA